MDLQPHGDAGFRYLWQSYYGLAELLHAAQVARKAQLPTAAPGKLYQGLPVAALPAQLPLVLGDAFATFPTYRAAHALSVGDAPLDRERLTQLLYYTYGVCRHDVGTQVEWPIHRVVPSARCRFPVELYLWLPEAGAAPGGFYHYDGLHHQLVRLRDGDHTAVLSRGLAHSLQGCTGALLIATMFNKTASYYFDFAYRLCTQEAGVVVGNSLLVAGALGIVARVCYDFLDAPINRLLGLDGVEEAVLAVVTLHREPDAGARPIPCAADALCAEIAPISPAVQGYVPLDRERCAQFLTLDRLARLEHTAALPRQVAGSRPAPSAPPTISFGLPPMLPHDLAAALHTRSSGDAFFQPQAVPTTRDQALELVRYVLEPVDDDIGGTFSGLRLFAVLNSVADVPPGVYELESAAAGLRLVRNGQFAEALRRAQPMMRCDTATMVCYIVGEYAPLTAALGERAYRVLQMQAGLIAERLCVLSAVFGMVARCSDSYSLDSVLSMLGLSESTWLPLIQVAIGHEIPGCGGAERYRLLIRF